MIELLFKLFVAHAIADFALQSEAMNKGKNRHRKQDNIPQGQKEIQCWPYWLTAHALINGGAVYLATGSVLVGLIELALHWIVDFAKCENWTGIHDDQFFHACCKIFYLLFLI